MAAVSHSLQGFNPTPTNSVYGAKQDEYVERSDQKISPHPSFLKRGITISPCGKGGIRGIGGSFCLLSSSGASGIWPLRPLAEPVNRRAEPPGRFAAMKEK